MKKKEPIQDLFERLEGSFDTQEVPVGHQKRFLEKLNKTEQQKSPRHMVWKVVSVAAAITLILFLASTFWTQEAPLEAELASVSPEMKETQSLFTTTINEEIQNLQQYESPETKELIDNVLAEVTHLENEYQQLKKDLVSSGNNKRVIRAMINNFQNRIVLLEQVAGTVEEIKTLKNEIDETTI